MRTLPSRLRRALVASAVVPAVLSLGACGGSGAATAAPADPSATAPELRLGYFANVTHAAALIGVSKNLVSGELGSTKLTTQVFNAGPAEVEALFAGGLDAAYIGPSPTITAYGQSNGDAVRIIAGASSGGAELVVKDGITSAADLKGKQVASPQLGNTQDVALRSWLKSQNLSSSVSGGGDVTVTPTANADVPALFDSGQLSGARMPAAVKRSASVDVADGRLVAIGRPLRSKIVPRSMTRAAASRRGLY